MSFGRKIADRMRPTMRKLQPVAKVLEAATQVIGRIKDPSVFGVMHAVAGGVRSMSEVLSPDDPNRWVNESFVGYGDMVEGLRRLGADVEQVEKNTRCYVEGYTIEVAKDGDLWFAVDPKDELVEICRRAADVALPSIVRVVDQDRGAQATPATLSDIVSPQAEAIWNRTRGMLDGGRAILLEGRPGVGKTTIAQVIARIAGLGRTVILDGEVVSLRRDHGSTPSVEMLAMLSPGVVIIDDIDKIKISLTTFERIRKVARLLILTANNGKHDAVLDAALMRPARVDEVFTIVSENPHRRPPFEMLSDKEWAEIRDWPCAYVNEVEKRLRSCPDDLRLDDLRERINRRTRSGEELL